MLARCSKKGGHLSCVLHSRPPFRPLALGRKTSFARVGNRGDRDRAVRLKKLTQLDNVANNTHDQETHSDGLRDAQELALVGYRGVHVSKLDSLHSSYREEGEVCGRERRTLAAPGDELAAVLDELARHLEEFLGLIHCC